MSEQFWRSLRNHGGTYEVERMAPENRILTMPPTDLSRFGVYPSEIEAVERAIRDNQRLARKIKDQVEQLKARRKLARTAQAGSEGEAG